MKEKKITVEEIYKKFTEPLPQEAIEKVAKEISRKGYDTVGYQYQYIVERLNQVLDIDGWHFEWEIVKEMEGMRGKYERKYYDITVKVTISVVIGEKVVSHQCIGGNRSEVYCDALKGAVTNGFKKTAAFFGIGQDAYKGIIDEDYRPVPISNGSTAEEKRKKEKEKKSGYSEIIKEKIDNLPESLRERLVEIGTEKEIIKEKDRIKQEKYFFLMNFLGNFDTVPLTLKKAVEKAVSCPFNFLAEALYRHRVKGKLTEAVLTDIYKTCHKVADEITGTG